MPAVVDLQNTVMKEFENDPRVETGMFSQGEDRSTLEVFWRNLFHRSQIVFDEFGDYSGPSYGQPDTDLPFSRAFIIGPRGKIFLPHFGHNGDFIIGKIYEGIEAEPITLAADPWDITGGDELTFTTWNGVPGTMGLLFLEEVDGNPMAMRIAKGMFDGEGIWQESLTVPSDPTLSGMTFKVRAFGLDINDQLLKQTKARVVTYQ